MNEHDDPHAHKHPAHVDGLSVVAVIGDGQLARMTQTAAIELGLSLRLLAGTDNSSAAQVTADVVVGDYTNLDDLLRAVDGATVVTFDHEHVPQEHLAVLASRGVNLQPGPGALKYAQNKLAMRTMLAEHGLPVPVFAEITGAHDAGAFWDLVQSRVCVKAASGGYDGKGVWFPGSKQEMIELVDRLLSDGVQVLAEEKITLTRELSAMVARRPSGETKVWPVVESVQEDGICTTAIAPAPGISDTLARTAQDIAVTIAGTLGVTGVMAVELFEFTAPDGTQRVSINELAMRPHNTGHWTQDGCVTSQFEQHIRAVADAPLGDTSPTADYTCMVNVLGADTDPEMGIKARVREVWKRFPEAKIHLYGKDWRPGRKLGHVTIAASDRSPKKLLADTRCAAGFLMHARWEDGYTTTG
ncbi:5-(carboxyamino)imidazole ribonucleotide synthase [Corynebacterium mendelii]|uniref:N5-carboxyaminoimidazole ribonucleotide synthase n=1 Tax=Corynebacterium mendelii TaxID=2765362 RepID=A0A939IXW8_9CORY|nr:5-(carboxyamino)imidazole ribonucleotide synthase [Corynebacterium mendelii]